MKRAAIVALGIVLFGCTNYYRVADPVSGNVYFTTDIDHSDSGAVMFTDSDSGKTVTIQNSEVTEIDHDEYLVGRANKEQQTEGSGTEPAAAK